MIARTLLHWLYLKKNLYLPPSQLQDIQRKKIRAIIKHAYENVPFYHRKFRNQGIKPADIKSVSDLHKIPVTTKAEVQTSSLKDLIARNIKVENCRKRSTSGSTGLPLTILIDEKGSDIDSSIWIRALSENGLKPWDKMAIICDPRSFPKDRTWFHRLGIMPRKFISIFDNTEKQLGVLKEFKPTAIKGYPSSLEILASSYKSYIDDYKPRLILTSAELLDNEARSRIMSTFKSDVLDNYATHEFSLLAWECTEHGGYHMNIDNLAIEFINNGEHVAHGERGEILCTALANKAMPLIRYRIGDVGVPYGEQCPCGRTMPLMKIVEGRVDDFLVSSEGRIIPPTIFFPYPFETLDGIKQFRVIQESKEKLTIQIAVREDHLYHDDFFGKARMRVQSLFGERTQVDFQIVNEIDRDRTGKLRKVISNVVVSFT